MAYLMPGDALCFYTEKQAGQVGHSVLIHFRKDNRGVEVYEGLPDGQLLPADDREAVAAHCTEDTFIGSTEFKGKPVVVHMHDVDQGPIKLEVSIPFLTTLN